MKTSAQKIVLTVVALATLLIAGFEVLRSEPFEAHYCDSNKHYCGGGAGIPKIYSYY